MPTQQAIGQLNASQGINTSGSPVPINDLGQIIYANFFNSGAINAEFGRLYEMGVTCTTDANGCPTFTFFSDVGNTPTNPPTFAVRGYPEIVLVGGKWGVPNETIQANFGASLTSSTGTEYVDHSYAIANTGYPAASNAIPPTSICFNADESGHVGSERDQMAESWFFDRCQNTGQGNELIGTFDNNYGTQSQTREHNNQLLEVMVHFGPINFQSNAYDDSSQGVRNPAQFYCSGPHTIGAQDYEIWYGRNGQNNITLAGTTQTGQSNPTGALVVFNRLGPAGGPYGTDLTNEGDITLDWSGILEFARDNLQQEFIDCNAWAPGGNAEWTNPSSPDNPFSRINDSNCGAVGGIEFGHEPQLNGPTDQPVVMTVNKLAVTVDGVNLGPTPDDCIDTVIEPPDPECSTGEVVCVTTSTDECSVGETVCVITQGGPCQAIATPEFSNPACPMMGDFLCYALSGCDPECGEYQITEWIAGPPQRYCLTDDKLRFGPLEPPCPGGEIVPFKFQVGCGG